MELGACDSVSEESKVQCVERLLRSKLPGYIVSCMLAAGFDTLDTLALETNRAIPSRSLKNTSLPTFQAMPGTCMLHYLDQLANFPLDTVLESSNLCKNCAQATYVMTSSMMLFSLLRRKRKKTVNQKQQLHKLQLEKFLL